MTELPPELEPRRDAIHDLVIARGTARRRRRRLTLVTLALLVVAVPFATVAIASGGTDTHRVQAISPTTLEPPTTTETVTSTSAPPSTSTTVPPTETSVVPTTRAEAPTTTPASVTIPTAAPLVCRNSKDPACGPFYYDPPLTNAPATFTVVAVKPANPKPGDKVVFRLRAKDPDSFIANSFCGEATFGDGVNVGCGPSCAGPLRFRYGAWDPPALRPSDTVLSVEHVYRKIGDFNAHFTVTADACGPRLSTASTAVTVHVADQ